jgi:hypothetical protein
MIFASISAKDKTIEFPDESSVFFIYNDLQGRNYMTMNQRNLKNVLPLLRLSHFFFAPTFDWRNLLAVPYERL